MPKNKSVSLLSERGGEHRHARMRQDFAHSASGHAAYKMAAETESSSGSGSLDLFNDDLAKRAVGNLFSKPESDDEPDLIGAENPEDSFFAEAVRQTGVRSYSAPDDKKDREQDHDSDGEYDDDDDYAEDEGVPVAGRSPLPMPKPAIKINSALPYPQAHSSADTSAEVAAVRVSRPLSMTRAAGSSGRGSTMSYFQDGDRPAQSAEDDEFNEFRQRYSVRKAGTPQAASYTETSHAETAQGRPGSGRVPREGSAVGRRRSSDPAMRGINSGNGGDSFIWAVPPVIRIAVVAITVLFLLIMVFIVYRNSVLNRQLREAVAKVEEISSANENNIKLREEASRDLDDANRRIESLTAELEARPQATTPPVNVTTPTQTPTATATPDTTTPALPTSYTVVSGDTLSRIAIRYYNSASPDNITRILQANPQISNANAIRPGMVLIIPAQ